VTDIASPLFKTDWPGAPRSKQSEKRDQFHADFDMTAQDKLLERCIALCKAFQTDRLRCFDFWRLDDQAPFRAAMDKKLREAADRCAKDGIILLLENEMACNTATGAESKRTLAAVPNKNFMLNWDPGNAGAAGEYPYSKGFSQLPKARIGHCHAKDVVMKDGKSAWAPVSDGVIDWPGQIRALHAMGYHYAVSLETHWRGAGTPEASTRVSMAGLKKVIAGAGLQC
jgi:sugar phosphate isomerase/epimerase